MPGLPPRICIGPAARLPKSADACDIQRKADPIVRVLRSEVRTEFAAEAHVEGTQVVPPVETELVIDKGLSGQRRELMICNSISENKFYPAAVF
jgi:hypothetical protein